MKPRRFCINDDERTAWFPEYRYFVPVIRPLTMWDIDPDRLFPWAEYPRYVRPPSPPATKVVPRVNGEVVVSTDEDTLVATVAVVLVPNEHTAARARRTLLLFHTSGEVSEDFLDYAVSTAAAYHSPTALRARIRNR